MELKDSQIFNKTHIIDNIYIYSTTNEYIIGNDDKAMHCNGLHELILSVLRLIGSQGTEKEWKEKSKLAENRLLDFIIKDAKQRNE